jgi:RNA polymerase sigma-70 factor (ECF subfamily)
VVLRDLEGLTYDEISDVLGVRVGTVRSRIARGRARLRDLLEER